MIVNAYLGAGRAEVAQELLSALVVSDPGNAHAHILLGSVYLAQTKPHLAEASVAAAIEIAPHLLEGYMALSKLYLASGNTSGAETAAREGLSRCAENTTLLLLLASTQERVGDYDAAIAIYERDAGNRSFLDDCRETTWRACYLSIVAMLRAFRGPLRLLAVSEIRDCPIFTIPLAGSSTFSGRTAGQSGFWRRLPRLFPMPDPYSFILG